MSSSAQRVLGIGVVVHGAATGDEPVGGIELAQLGHRQPVDASGGIRGLVHRPVVDDREVPVLRQLDVDLEHVGTHRLRSVEGVEGVHRGLVLAAGVGHVHHPLPEPRVALLSGGRDGRPGDGKQDGGQRGK